MGFINQLITYNSVSKKVLIPQVYMGKSTWGTYLLYMISYVLSGMILEATSEGWQCQA